MSESRAGWSALDPADAVQGDSDSARNIATPEHARYEIHDRIGQGGMGTVFVALDRRLGREIALKRVSLVASSPNAQERLAKEAEITAWLEHPSIVPVYDAGIESEGTHFYTMRLVRGRSLREAIAEAGPPGDERALRALLRHYLAACQAVAFAHSRGVVHRDLTPSNIMVGAFGETQVVDWGLAARVEDRALSVVGTPGYMSPDDAATTRGDVWSLGAILKDMLAPKGTPLDSLDESTPTELRAVLRGCLADDPAERFADAGALAQEVEHYLDGRRVTSHDYSLAELLGRAWKARRPQILAVSAAVVVVIAVSVLASLRLRAERDRATEAERETTVALRAQSDALRESLEQQAVVLLGEGRARASEAAALRALKLGETPGLRGALLDLHARPRPTLITEAALPECDRIEPAGPNTLVCWGDGSVTAFDRETSAPRWSHDVVATEVRGLPHAVAVLGSAGVLSLHAIDSGTTIARWSRQSRFAGIARDHGGAWLATSGGGFLDVVGTHAPYQHLKLDACGDELVAAVGLGTNRVFVACRSGRVLGADIGTWTFDAVGVVPNFDPSVPLVAVAVRHDDRSLAISDSNGEAVQLHASGDVAAGRTKVAPGMATLAFVGEHVLVNPAGGNPALWNLAGRTRLLEFPGSSVFYQRSDAVFLSIDGTVGRMWPAPADVAASAFRADAGVAAASQTDTLVAAASADGVVSIWQPDGSRVRVLRIGSEVIKRAVFSPDGQTLAVAFGSDTGLRLFDTTTWNALPAQSFPGGVRSLDWRGDELVVAPYQDRVHLVRGHADNPGGPTGALDLSINARGDIAALGADGTVWWCDADASTFREVLERPGTGLVHALARGPSLATAKGPDVQLHRLDDGSAVGFRVDSASATDIASSADDRYLFVATIDGAVEVWTTNAPALVARWSAHKARVSHLRVHRDQLLSAGWDGWVKRWRLAPLDFDASRFHRESTAAWGQGHR
ncbi:MAG: protein kinase [Myxococcota bacterium]